MGTPTTTSSPASRRRTFGSSASRLGRRWTPARDLVITSRVEASAFGENVVAIEDLSQDPMIMEGQVLSRLVRRVKEGHPDWNRPRLEDRGRDVLWWKGARRHRPQTLWRGRWTLWSSLVEGVSHSSCPVKIGGGEPKTSLRLAQLLRERLPPSASVEIVDESGTSGGKRGAVGATKDQRAASKIAFRKGVQFSEPAPPRRSRG